MRLYWSQRTISSSSIGKPGLESQSTTTTTTTITIRNITLMPALLDNSSYNNETDVIWSTFCNVQKPFVGDGVQVLQCQQVLVVVESDSYRDKNWLQSEWSTTPADDQRKIRQAVWPGHVAGWGEKWEQAAVCHGCVVSLGVYTR